MTRSCGEEHEREGAFELEQRFAEGAGEGALLGVRQQVQDDFGVAGGLEDGAVAAEVGAEFGGVGDVAVVGDGDAALAASRRRRAGR